MGDLQLGALRHLGRRWGEAWTAGATAALAEGLIEVHFRSGWQPGAAWPGGVEGSIHKEPGLVCVFSPLPLRSAQNGPKPA